MITTETLDFHERTPEKLTGYETLVAFRSMIANRLSFQFDFKGINSNFLLKETPYSFIISVVSKVLQIKVIKDKFF